jgi:hypothetical protein
MTKDEAFLMAIEALENADYHRADEAITAIKAALEAKNEIVEWKIGASGIGGMGVIVQPQRTWVGLTDEEILAKCESVPDYDIGNHDLISFAKAIEAKLRSNNENR